MPAGRTATRGTVAAGDCDQADLAARELPERAGHAVDALELEMQQVAMPARRRPQVAHVAPVALAVRVADQPDADHAAANQDSTGNPARRRRKAWPTRTTWSASDSRVQAATACSPLSGRPRTVQSVNRTRLKLRPAANRRTTESRRRHACMSKPKRQRNTA